MSGGAAVCVPGRVRIKGKTPSVIRFCLISMAYLMPWVLLTSELGHYSQLYGPQVLLQLNLAFYMPSIPILLALGQMEHFLNSKLGATRSMLVRLNLGLVGCLTLCAAFPFFPEGLSPLMCVVVAMGIVHAIAFSTSYQLVSWFRQADTIALGIGCVGTGPLVLLIQLGLGIGPVPYRWQWIAMFEVAAAICLAGLLSSVSLFGQYWTVFEGSKAQGGDAEQPLLVGQEQGVCTMPRTTTLTHHILMAPDPFGGSPVIFCPDEDFEHYVSRMDSAAPVLRRSASMSVTGRSASKMSDFVGASAAGFNGFRSVDHSTMANATRWAAATQHATADSAASSPADSPLLPLPAAGGTPPHAPGAGGGSDLAAGPTPFSNLRVAMDTGATSGSGRDTPPSYTVLASAPNAAGSGAAGGADLGSSGAMRRSLGSGKRSRSVPVEGQTAGQEAMLVLRAVWPVVLAFLCSVTVLYLIFPFFTYVNSSGLLGDRLPQWLFFTRIFADLLGRFLPRRKALLVKSPTLLLALASVKVVVAILFFVYLRLFVQWHNDIVFIAIIIFLWLAGGYINTSCNILAPNLVEAHLTARASAIMALTFQVSHFSGLLLAVLVAFLLYGDVVG